MSNSRTGLTRIGVFYDGNYFLHVSNYYNYTHERRSRISISGLHEFIRQQVSEKEETPKHLCQLVDAHYFRGRLNAHEANQRGNQLFYDRLFDDILMSEGVVTHYLPVKTHQGLRQEKGIDVWFALECYELALYKKFDVIVLITADGDYVSLIRKLNTLGTRVMVLSWDFEYISDDGEKQVTRTSQDLLEEVSYPLAMHEVIDNRLRKNDLSVQNLFVKNQPRVPFAPSAVNGNGTASAYSPAYAGPAYQPPEGGAVDEPNFNRIDVDGEEGEDKLSTIRSLKTGYGFINFPPNNLFFHYTSLIDVDFNELQLEDQVMFRLGQNAEGKDIAVDVRLIES